MTALIKIALTAATDPAPSFNTPLEMLAECHRRVEAQCATLKRLVPHLAEKGPDQASREAAAAIMRYFDLAAPKHHADEEDDLFPALLESMAGSDAVCLNEIVRALRAEHAVLEGQWQALRLVLMKVADGIECQLEESAVNEFAQRYDAHIAREEGELLPMAERLLSDQTMQAIGRSMQRRRIDS